MGGMRSGSALCLLTMDLGQFLNQYPCPGMINEATYQLLIREEVAVISGNDYSVAG